MIWKPATLTQLWELFGCDSFQHVGRWPKLFPGCSWELVNRLMLTSQSALNYTRLRITWFWLKTGESNRFVTKKFYQCVTDNLVRILDFKEKLILLTFLQLIFVILISVLKSLIICKMRSNGHVYKKKGSNKGLKIFNSSWTSSALISGTEVFPVI